MSKNHRMKVPQTKVGTQSAFCSFPQFKNLQTTHLVAASLPRPHDVTFNLYHHFVSDMPVIPFIYSIACSLVQRFRCKPVSTTKRTALNNSLLIHQIDFYPYPIPLNFRRRGPILLRRLKCVSKSSIKRQICVLEIECDLEIAPARPHERQAPPYCMWVCFTSRFA